VVFSSDEDAPFLSADDERKVDEFTKFMVTKVNSNQKNRTTVGGTAAGSSSNSFKTPSATKNQQLKGILKRATPTMMEHTY